MGLNWSQGLQNLGQGLGTLAQHSIYKDEQARQERLQQAQTAFEERRIALAEKQAAQSTEFMGRQLDQGDRRIDIDEANVASTAEFRERQLGMMEDEQSFRRERAGVEDERYASEQQFRSEQATIQNQLSQDLVDIKRAGLPTETEREITAYASAAEPLRERAWTLHEQMREIEGNAALPEDVKQRQVEEIRQQMIGLKEDEINLQIRAGINGIDRYPEEVGGQLRAFMNEKNVNEARVIRMLEEGSLTLESGSDFLAPETDQQQTQPGGQGSAVPANRQPSEPILTRLGRASNDPLETLWSGYQKFWDFAFTPTPIVGAVDDVVNTFASGMAEDFMAGRRDAQNEGGGR